MGDIIPSIKKSDRFVTRGKRWRFQNKPYRNNTLRQISFQTWYVLLGLTIFRSKAPSFKKNPHYMRYVIAARKIGSREVTWYIMLQVISKFCQFVKMYEVDRCFIKCLKFLMKSLQIACSVSVKLYKYKILEIDDKHILYIQKCLVE